MLNRSQIETIVAGVLGAQLGDYGFSSASVAFEEDFDGEEVIRVMAHLERRVEEVVTMMDSADAIRVQLINMHDDRYVFLSQSYPGADDGKADADQLTGSLLS